MIFYKLYFLYNVGLIRSFSMTINPVYDFFLFVFTNLRFSCLSCLLTKIYHHVSACSIQNCINNFPLKSDKIMLQKYKLYVLTFNDFYPLFCKQFCKTTVKICLTVNTKRIHHWCSAGTGKSQLESPPFQWKTRLRRVSHWNGGPEGWDFPVPLYTNDRFYFSHI